MYNSVNQYVSCVCTNKTLYAIDPRSALEPERVRASLDTNAEQDKSEMLQRSQHGRTSQFMKMKQSTDSRNWLARLCETPECCVMRYCWWLIALSITTVVFLVLFIVFAVRDTASGSCVLTYNGNGAVTEDMMLKWTTHEQWPLARPTFDKERQACVCDDARLDPQHIPMTAPVVVWIAPGDLVSLYLQGDLSSLPKGFAETHQGDYRTQDHVKVCLEHRHLVQLWGTNATNTHCHNITEVTSRYALKTFFLGYDGVLFCKASITGSSPKKGTDNGHKHSHIPHIHKPQQTPGHKHRPRHPPTSPSTS